VFAPIVADAEGGNNSIQGILSLYSIDVRVLFDTDSTYSFIAPHVPISKTTLSYYLFVTTLGDMVLMGSVVFKDCEIRVHNRNYRRPSGA